MKVRRIKPCVFELWIAVDRFIVSALVFSIVNFIVRTLGSASDLVENVECFLLT